jgi:hypothetical protein
MNVNTIFCIVLLCAKKPWNFYTNWLPVIFTIFYTLCDILFPTRLDSTLIDFADMKWQRGDISIIFNGEAEGLYRNS